MLTYTLKVEKLTKETDDAVTLSFKQPGLKKIRYKAGQYLTLIFRINGRRYIRPYSFSSAPGVDTTLNITVKRVPGGVVSNHIIDKVQVGDMIEVFEPMGDFTLDAVQGGIQQKHIVLWGSGSGITPLMSIAKYALINTDGNHVTLVYGNRSSETTIFGDEIRELQSKYASCFSVWHFHTRPTISELNPYIIEGRIDPEKVVAIMKKEGKLANTTHFICGPVGLKNSVKTALLDMGISAGHILSEDFEVTRDPKEFENIFTQNVFVTLGNTENVFEVTKGKSVLEAGLDAMLELSYSCQIGSCQLCRATLISGEIKTIGLQQLPNVLEKNECLLCCAFPLTDNVKLLIKD
jgi:ring-1,2-phenylacetyl-CoA epoxidase subunit PaaE